MTNHPVGEVITRYNWPSLLAGELYSPLEYLLGIRAESRRVEGSAIYEQFRSQCHQRAVAFLKRLARVSASSLHESLQEIRGLDLPSICGSKCLRQQ
jgi:hypothetical protein